MTLAPYRRMPTAFGPAPGPRNVPTDASPTAGPPRQSVVSFTAEVRPDAVEALLPRRVALRAPTLQVQLVTFENLHWLAGRGYDALSVSVPVRHTGPGGSVDANFLVVMWENMAEPVITGRDELGFPKLFADIDVTDPAQTRQLSSIRAQASWEGTPFFRAELDHAEPADPVTSGLPLITHRWVPSVGNLGLADADYLTITAAATGPSSTITYSTITYSAVASGTFAFDSVTWNDVPVQYPVINALAGIDIESIGPARIVCSEGGANPASNRRMD